VGPTAVGPTAVGPAPALTSYVRQAREHPAYRWWRLPAAGVIAIPLFFVVSVAVVAACWALAPGPVGDFMESAELELNARSHPAILILALGSIAVMLPCVWIAILITGPRPVGHLSSVYGRLRWGWMLRALVAALIIWVGSILFLTLVLDPTPVTMPSRATIIGIAIMLAFTPFQAAAEEYVFRGYLMQLVGSWTTWVWVPVVVSVPLFALAHGYSRWGTVDVAIFGLTAAILVVRTGGLEAAIALHIANNCSLAVLEAFGLVDTSDTGTGPWDVFPSVIMSAVFLLVVEWMFRRSGLFRGRRRAQDPAVGPVGLAGEPAAL
jgi:membrane protease YdiL (CAAX protease family)